jgi:hypothetical protein
MRKSKEELERSRRESDRIMHQLALSDVCGMSLAKIDLALQLYGLPKHERNHIIGMVREFGVSVLRRYA